MEDLNLFKPTFRVEECLNEIRDCLERGWTGMGFKTAEFEEAWCAYTGLPNAHFLNSATAALNLTFELLKNERGWSAGDEIITTPITFVSTNHAILHAELTPVFADVDEYMCMDPTSMLSRISSKTRAVIFVGLGGSTGQLLEIHKLCQERGLTLILDAAHMAGTKLDGKDPGNLCDVVCYSFQAVKNLPTADSGMVCFKDSKLDSMARKYSWLGISRDTYARSNHGTYKWDYDVEFLGHKYHGNSIMAALGLIGLRYLDRDNEFRRTLSSRYTSNLAESSSVRPIPIPENCLSSRHLFQVSVSDRDATIRQLNSARIYPGVHYRSNQDYSIYRQYDHECPNAEQASRELLSLPLHVQMTFEDVDRVSKTLLAHQEHSP